MTNIYDIHSHVLFSLDDGATDINESVAMLKLMISDGVTDVFCTSHDMFYPHEYMERFNALQERVKELGLNINLHKGSEIYCDYTFVNDTIRRIKSGIAQPLGNSNHYLIEFDPYSDKYEIIDTIKKIIDRTGTNIILAHTERYVNLCPDTQAIKLLSDYGVKFQINAYSLVEETNVNRKNFARTLLLTRRVSFIGSDSHRLTHRPPKSKNGIAYIKENCDKEYANSILYGNAEKYLL